LSLGAAKQHMDTIPDGGFYDFWYPALLEIGVKLAPAANRSGVSYL